MTLIDVGKKTFAAVLQVAFLWADLVLLLGFTFFNNLRTSPISHAGLVLMLFGDAVSFGLSWWKPRAGGLLLIGVSAVSLMFVLLGASKDGIASLWLTGMIFWGAKVLLALMMLRRSSVHVPIEHASSGLSL